MAHKQVREEATAELVKKRVSKRYYLNGSTAELLSNCFQLVVAVVCELKCSRNRLIFFALSGFLLIFALLRI